MRTGQKLSGRQIPHYIQQHIRSGDRDGWRNTDITRNTTEHSSKQAAETNSEPSLTEPPRVRPMGDQAVTGLV